MKRTTLPTTAEVTVSGWTLRASSREWPFTVLKIKDKGGEERAVGRKKERKDRGGGGAAMTAIKRTWNGRRTDTKG